MSRRTRFPSPRFCRLMKNWRGKKRTRLWDTNKENRECSSFCLGIQAFFFTLTNTGTGKWNTDGLLRLQHKNLPRDSSSCRITCDSQRVGKLLIWEAYSPFALSRENLLVKGPVSKIFWFYFRFHAEFENCFLAKMRLKVSRSSFLFGWFIWFICPGTVDIVAFYCNFSWAW